MKSMKKTFLTTVIAGGLIVSMTLTAAAFTETRGTVNGTGVSIRAEASAQSERVSSVTSGDRLDVIDETTDANGNKWYKVRVDANRTGFIRADLITLENASSSSSSDTSAAAATTTASSSSETTQTGTVISDRINVRKEASATSEAIGALARDARIYVTGTVTGSDGNRWYQVKYSTGGVEKVGFVRSDLLRVGDSASSTATTSAAAATTAASAATTASTVSTTSGNSTASTVKELTPQAGTITGNTVNVRSAAGTSNDSVGALTRNTQVTITGETTGSDNAKWYRVNFTSNGSEKTGFIRADLMRVGTPAAEPAGNTATTTVSTTPASSTGAQTETPTEQPAPEEVSEAPAEGEGTEGAQEEAPASDNTSNMGDEYSLVRTAGSDGVEAWYLYDNVNKNRAKVEDLMNAARSIGTLTDLEQSNKTLKTALIILGILLVLLLAAVIFLFMKMRNLLYYEDEGEEEIAPRRREKVTPQPERERTSRKKSAAQTEDDGMDRIRRREERRRPAESAAAARPEKTAKPAGAASGAATPGAVTDKAAAQEAAAGAGAARRRPKNFVRDEDFEFEFLDLDEDKK